MYRNAFHAELDPKPQEAGGSQRESQPLLEKKVEALHLDGAPLEDTVLGGDESKTTMKFFG